MNPTYEMCRAGSEHGVKGQRQSLTNQLRFLHGETQSHHPTKSISLLGFHFGLEAVAQRSSYGPAFSTESWVTLTPGAARRARQPAPLPKDTACRRGSSPYGGGETSGASSSWRRVGGAFAVLVVWPAEGLAPAPAVLARRSVVSDSSCEA